MYIYFYNHHSKNSFGLQAYTNIDQKVAALEEQLVDLDQQHQAALEVAINSRDQLKEENQQLQLQLMQLINDRQQEQQVSLAAFTWSCASIIFIFFFFVCERLKVVHFFQSTRNPKSWMSTKL
jgi:hypothetical protein